MIPKSRRGAGGREIPPCLCALSAHIGGGGGAYLWEVAGPVPGSRCCSACALRVVGRHMGGCVCPVLRAPAAGQGSCTLRPLGESVGQVTCGFLRPTAEPPGRTERSQDVWSVALLDLPRGAQAALHRALDLLGASWWMEGPSRDMVGCSRPTFSHSNTANTRPSVAESNWLVATRA